MIKVLLVDDHTLFREGLKQILFETADIIVTGEASNASEAMDLICRVDYNMIVLDISMPGRTGLDVLMQLKVMKSKVRILVLSMYAEEEYALRALKCGAAGYLRKNSVSKELIEAIHKVSSGRKYISPELAEQLAAEVGRETSVFPHMNLSNREYEVMCMIAAGKTVQQIAAELSLSKSTISTHRGRLLKKMKKSTNAEITHYAIKEKLVI